MSDTTEVTLLPAEGHRGVGTFSVAVIESAGSFDALMEAFRRVEADHRRQGRCFVTLDDLGQCLYTSGHARAMYELDEGIDYPQEDTPEALAAYEVARFHVGVTVLRDPARVVAWETVCGSLAIEPEDIDALVALNHRPDLVLDDQHVVQCLPTDDAADLLADIPNGYFAADLSPFDNHAIARRMSERHGYALFGVGAATLGFFSTIGADERDWDALLADLQQLYGDQGAVAWAELVPVLRESRVLLLGYTEDFAALTE